MYPGVKLLEGKRALVTGVANRWSIATGIARKFHEYGAELVLTYQGERVKDEVEKLAAELGGAQVIECDVSSDASLEAMRVEVARTGKLDVLVHCMAFANKADLAGVKSTIPAARASPRSTFRPFRWSRSSRRCANSSTTRVGDGAHVSRCNADRSELQPDGHAKAALESSMRYLAFDLGDRGIRVNAISAGPIKTASMRQVGGATKMLDVVPKVAPLRRNVTAEDVGNTAVYLASDLSSAITADVHFVDAGYHMMGFYPPDFDK